MGEFVVNIIIPTLAILLPVTVTLYTVDSRIKARNNKHYAESKELQKEKKDNYKKFYKEHKDERKEYYKEHYEKNKKERQKYYRDYYKRKKEAQSNEN